MNIDLNIPVSNTTQVVDEESFVAEVDKRIRSQEVILRDFHRQWFVNIAMRRGLQYIQTHAGTGLVVMPPDSEDRVRIVVNKMLGIHQTRVAKLSIDLPKLEVVPSSAQEEDKDLARKGTKLLSWVWANEEMVEKMITALSWMVDCGDAFFHIYWDTDKGTEIPCYKRHTGKITENMPYKIDDEGYILDKDGRRVEERISIGDVAIDVHPPFDIINDGTSMNIQDSPWIIIQQATSIQDIRKKWGDRGRKVSPERDLNTRAYFQRRLQTMVGNQSTYFAPEPKQYEDCAILKTMFERPSDTYPEGRRIVVANGVLLESGGMPYEHGEYPIVKISDIEVSGSFWSISTMENLIPIQKGYNRTWSQIIENANNMGNIKVWAEKGHGLQKESYDDTGTEFLEVEPGHNITQLQPASLPSYVVNQLDWYDRAFEDVSGVHEVSNAKVPSGVSSAKALMVLQEQDDTRLAPCKIRFHRAMEEMGTQILQLYAEFQDEERTYQLLGESANDVEEFSISIKEIKSMKKDVRVQSENIIAAHKRLQQDGVLEMYDKGLFGAPDDPNVRKKVLSLLEFGNVQELFDEINLDESQAKRENRQFINHEGLLPNLDPDGNDVLTLPAYDFEDHEIHIREHNSFRKSPRYRQMTDAMRKGIDVHVKIHENFLNPPPPPAPPPQPEIPLPEPLPPPPPAGIVPEGAPGAAPPLDMAAPPPLPPPAMGPLGNV